MSLKETIQNDMKTAMRAKDQATLRALRAIKAAILNEEVSEGRQGASLTEKDEIKLLMKQAKQRRDSLEQYQQNGREDLAATEQEELAVIERYLPKQLSEEEIEGKVKTIIDQVGASSMKDMGKVMGVASKEMAGKADGKTISTVVKRLLG
jgi:uncharacterized protein